MFSCQIFMAIKDSDVVKHMNQRRKSILLFTVNPMQLLIVTIVWYFWLHFSSTEWRLWMNEWLYVCVCMYVYVSVYMDTLPILFM